MPEMRGDKDVFCTGPIYLYSMSVLRVQVPAGNQEGAGMKQGWGVASRYNLVHYFGERGLPICDRKKRLKSRPDMFLHHWDPAIPGTCPICRAIIERRECEKEQEKARAGNNG